MIALHSEYFRSPQSSVAYQVSKDGRFGWFLSTWHPEKANVLEEIQANIKLEILNSDLQSVSKLSIENWLKKFFADFHWKLHANFRKTDLKEKGISLFFGVLYDHELFFVQFGRLVCAQCDNKKIEAVGNNWQNYHIRSMENLCLLGESEQDLKIKVQRVFIPEHEKFIVLPALLAARVFAGKPDPATISTLIETTSADENISWLILEGKTKLIKSTRRRINRLQISTMILLFISILTILYMVFGNRFIDQNLRKLKLLFEEKKSVRWEQIPNYLNLDSSNIIKQIERVVNLPVRDIEFRTVWSTDLPYTITATPVFSIENLYIASDNKLLAYNKKSRQLLWKLSLESPIRSLTIARGSLVVLLDNGNAMSLRDDGKLYWKQKLEYVQTPSGIRHPIELSNDDDPRLDGSIMIIAEERGISALDGVRGEQLSKISFRAPLQHLSEYDRFENCFYAVVEDEIICIELKIVN